MFEWFSTLHPIMQALVATLFTWFLTALGAGLVFFFKRINRKVLDGMLGFAAGVMIAASYWSLLAPAIEMAEAGPLPAYLPAAIGFLLGGVFLLNMVCLVLMSPRWQKRQIFRPGFRRR